MCNNEMWSEVEDVMCEDVREDLVEDPNWNDIREVDVFKEILVPKCEEIVQHAIDSIFEICVLHNLTEAQTGILLDVYEDALPDLDYFYNNIKNTEVERDV